MTIVLVSAERLAALEIVASAAIAIESDSEDLRSAIARLQRIPVAAPGEPAPVGRVLASMRMAAGLSQEDLGEALYSRRDNGYVSRVETGKVSPGADMIQRWVTACGAPLTFWP